MHDAFGVNGEGLIVFDAAFNLATNEQVLLGANFSLDHEGRPNDRAGLFVLGKAGSVVTTGSCVARRLCGLTHFAGVSLRGVGKL